MKRNVLQHLLQPPVQRTHFLFIGEPEIPDQHEPKPRELYQNLIGIRFVFRLVLKFVEAGKTLEHFAVPIRIS